MAIDDLRSSTSPLPPRKRRRSPPPSSPDDHADDAKRRRTDLSVEVCKEFMRSGCRRSELDCKFAHPHSSVAVDNNKVTACADSVRNKCFRGRACRYYHPPPHIQVTLLNAIGASDTKVEQICRDFLRGKCSRAAKECRFAHHTSVDNCAVTCQDFLRGKCERKTCRYSHDQVYMAPQVHLLQYGAVMSLPSTTSPPRTANDKEIQVCKDFLKNRCHRDECKYVHPGSRSEVNEDQVEVCRDFHRGACNRSVCRFYHPQRQT